MKKINFKIYLKNFILGKKQTLMILLPIIVSILLVYGYFHYSKYILNLFLEGIKLNYVLKTNIESPVKINPVDSSQIASIIDTVYHHNINKHEEQKTVKVNKTGIENTTNKTNNKPPLNYKISFIYIGFNKNYAIINKRLLKEGDNISSKEKVVKIERNKVLLEGTWGKRWIYFIK